MRTFIAIDLNQEIKKALTSLLRNLRQTKAQVKWVNENSFHLTLKFLGEITEEQVHQIVLSMMAVAHRYKPFPLECRATGRFPQTGSPRVFWVGVTPSSELLSLQKEIEGSLETIGFSREERPFQPHLTLGRVKANQGLEAVERELKKYQDMSFGQMEVKAITLFQSLLKPSGAEYRHLQEVKLG